MILDLLAGAIVATLMLNFYNRTTRADVPQGDEPAENIELPAPAEARGIRAKKQPEQSEGYNDPALAVSAKDVPPVVPIKPKKTFAAPVHRESFIQMSFD